ncbi:MAG: hypothetical protein OXE84_07135 [Rhodobacteraceae bacterium]|nr:hypothetical protein [Paracoccaceae bacterium]MCY4197467.1 hypothetical protein [Paracoccaceae bacterium]
MLLDSPIILLDSRLWGELYGDCLGIVKNFVISELTLIIGPDLCMDRRYRPSHRGIATDQLRYGDG